MEKARFMPVGKPGEVSHFPVSGKPEDAGKFFMVLRDRTEPNRGRIRPGKYTVIAFREIERSGPMMVDRVALTPKGAVRKAKRLELVEKIKAKIK